MIQLEDYDNIPLKEPNKEYKSKLKWRRKYSNGHKVKYFSDSSKSAYRIVDFVIKKFLGKSYDKAFSYYCSKVMKSEQYLFEKKFKKDFHWSWEPDYIVDKQGRIQKNKNAYKKAKEPIIFYSHDYVSAYRDKKTGEIIKKAQFYWYNNESSEYEEIVISGYSKEFKSAKDPEFIRLTNNKKQFIAKQKRDLKLAKDQENELLLHNIEASKKEKEMAINNTKIQAHGFGDDSFKGIEYHGEKRKLKLII